MLRALGGRPDAYSQMIATTSFLLVVCGLIPLLAWNSYRYLSSESESEGVSQHSDALAIQALVIHSVVAGLAAVAARSAQLHLVWLSRPTVFVVCMGFLIIIVFTYIAVLEAKRPLTTRDSVRAKLRSDGLSKPWIATMFVAAIAEEYAYRGVLYGVLEAHVPPAAALAIAALVFGLGHLSQGVRGAVLGIAFAVSMQLLLLVSGALVVPMICHLIYDLAVSSYGRNRLS